VRTGQKRRSPRRPESDGNFDDPKAAVVAATSGARSKGIRILVVDDDVGYRRALCAMLESEGYDTAEAGDGQEALEKLGACAFDAAITDILMPKMDGYRFCYEVRRNEKLRDLRIIIHSGTYTSPADEGLASSVGADRFIGSPATTSVFLETLEGVLREERAFPKPVPEIARLDVLQQFSDRLVAELEHRNRELESAKDRLGVAFAALQESEKRYRELVALAPIGIFQMTPDGEILAANAAFAKMLGYSSEELLRLKAEDLYFHPSERAAVWDRVERLGHLRSFEVRLRRKDERPVWNLADARVVRDPSGKIERYEIFATDVTEQRRASDALRSSEERYRCLMDRAQDAIFVLDEREIVVEANQAAENLLVRTRAEIVGQSFLETLAPENRQELHDRLDASLRGDGVRGAIASILRSDGRRAPVEISTSVVEIGGEPLVLATLRDVSERNALAEQLRLSQKMEAVGQLAGGIAHDFNNLLTAILGYSEIIAADLRGNPELFEAVSEIHNAGKRAAALTRQLLAFSRKQVLELKVLDLNEIVRHIEKMLARLLGEDIELVTRLDPQVGAVRADAGQIEQVILNLAINARDAMPKGGLLTIETANIELDQSYVQKHVSTVPGRYSMLTVSDVGTGMDEATQARIFEPFFTTKEKGYGTGLGLSTVYGIVKQSGGYVWVYSERGRGTRFKIYLPRVDAVAETVFAPEALASRGGAETILLVEDEDAVRALASKILETSGYRVTSARTGDEAIELARVAAEPFHLLVTDMVLPGIGGAEIAARIRERFPEVKVLYASGYSDAVILQRGHYEKGAAFLEKPFSAAALSRKVREVLDS
jgi:two-component system, cell cycle sensor histidine kinase and response regulator CckA